MCLLLLSVYSFVCAEAVHVFLESVPFFKCVPFFRHLDVVIFNVVLR